jgi:hypothetical protein
MHGERFRLWIIGMLALLALWPTAVQLKAGLQAPETATATPISGSNVQLIGHLGQGATGDSGDAGIGVCPLRKVRGHAS